MNRFGSGVIVGATVCVVIIGCAAVGRAEETTKTVQAAAVSTVPVAMKPTRIQSAAMGDWQGKTMVARVLAFEGGRYLVNLLGAFDTADKPTAVLQGAEQGDKVVFEDQDYLVAIEAGQMKVEKKGAESYELKKVERKSPTLGAKPPKGAVVLFDGKNLDQWQKADGSPAGWKLAGEGAMEVVRKAGNIESKKKFKDAKYHIEFRTPFMPAGRGQHRGNSGVYLQGCYEVQVLDSYGLESKDNECGGIYKVGAPRVNMCAPPLQWQTYDITFHGARFDDKGQKTANARISVDQNGVNIHKDLEIPAPTGSAKQKDDPKDGGVLMLQEHGGDPVQYRNIWVVELDGDGK